MWSQSSLASKLIKTMPTPWHKLGSLQHFASRLYELSCPGTAVSPVQKQTPHLHSHWVEWRPVRPYTNACSQGLTAGRDGFVKSLRTGLKSLKHVKTLRLRHRAAERSESSCSCVLFTSQISCLNGQFSLNGLLRREEQTSLVEVSLSQRQERSSISPNAAFPDLSGRILRTSGCTQISQSSEIAFLLAIFMLWTRTLELIFHFQHFKYHTLQKQKSSLASGITVLPNQMSIIPILHSNTS